jgi:hypothetical protein
MSYGGTYYGALVFGAGLVVAAFTPVPPAATDSNGYGTSGAGGHVYGAGVVVTSQVPVPPVGSTKSNGYGTCVYGSGVYGAGCVVTSQVPVPPTPATPTERVTSGSGYRHGKRLLHVATVALVQSPAVLEARATVEAPARGAVGHTQAAARLSSAAMVIPRELTEAGEEELLIAMLSE